MSLLPNGIEQLLAPAGDGNNLSAAKRTALNYADPIDNLYAFGKLWAGYGGVPVYPAFRGTMFGLVGTGRLKPLFGYTGFGNFEAKVLDNGHVKLRGKETGYFTDLETGDILEHWDNPYTGETVEVFNFLNNRIRGELTPTMPVFHFGDSADAPTLMNDGSCVVNEDGSVPFILPWERSGEQMLLSWDYTHRYRNPVTADHWPKACTGEYINPSEHFTFFTRAEDLANRELASAPYTCGFSRLSPWWPWMKMGQSGIDGHLFGRMHSHKSNQGFTDIPPKVLAYAEKHHPEYLEACTDWDDGFPIGTWEAYARDTGPENN
ncbi:MAG: DUF1838 family protein [Pseudomonadales bacterium]